MSKTRAATKDELCEAIGRAIVLARLANSRLTLHILLIALLNECEKDVLDEIEVSEDRKFYLV